MKNNHAIADTLVLHANKTYTRKVYYFSNKIAFFNKGNWKKSNNRMILYNYSVNEEGEIYNNKEVYRNLMTVDFPIRKKADKIIFVTQINSEENFYENER